MKKEVQSGQKGGNGDRRPRTRPGQKDKGITIPYGIHEDQPFGNSPAYTGTIEAK